MLSIIIPTYNAEKSLQKCLERLKNQTCNDFEVILVDDGSIDKSANVYKPYCLTDPHFKFIRQKNGGCGSARNTGIKIASGNLISFIDADDWVEPNYVETIIRNMNGDFLFFSCTHHNKKNDITYHKNEDHKNTTFFDILLKQFDYWDYAFTWNKCFKKDIILSNNLSFDKDLKHAEDELFILEYLMHTNKISTISDVIYHYQVGIGISQVYATIEEVKKINHRIFQLSDRYKDQNISAYLKIRGINYWYNAYTFKRCNLFYSYNQVRKDLKKSENKYLRKFLSDYSYNRKITLNKQSKRFEKIILSDNSKILTYLKLSFFIFYEWQKKISETIRHNIGKARERHLLD